jgi:Fur family zinc uptake transcriptional regulator
MSHTHQEPLGDHLMQAAERTIAAAGEQWTGMRALVFKALSRFDKPASAYDIADEVSKARGRRVAPNSIYRILDLFVATNLAKRVESRNAFIANAHPACRHDCIFLVCDGCGATTHLDDDSLSDAMRARARAAGFVPEQPVLEMRGRCAACA